MSTILKDRVTVTALISAVAGKINRINREIRLLQVKWQMSPVYICEMAC